MYKYHTRFEMSYRSLQCRRCHFKAMHVIGFVPTFFFLYFNLLLQLSMVETQEFKILRLDM